jgi:hypothetical protein
MATIHNRCQHIDTDGYQCSSCDYIRCPHCQLQVCLKHLNSHQDLLRSDLHVICDRINRLHATIDGLTFDANNHRQYLGKQLDQWYNEQIVHIKKIYEEKKRELDILYLKSQMEFDFYKIKKEKQLKDNLDEQLKKVLRENNIYVDDINMMKRKLDSIQHGLDVLQRFNIDIDVNVIDRSVNVCQRGYIQNVRVNISI